ncbi:MAG: hypothetical protein LBK72_08670, partial [Bifidobacteriaceae bacterium]|nr:hypothetical protein [Bifidobacteriaceae bacterium]
LPHGNQIREVLDVERGFAQPGHVLTAVVRAEHEFPVPEEDPQVGSGAAPIAPISGGQCWTKCGIESHVGLQR